MAAIALGTVLGNLRRSVLRKGELGLTDGDLLERVLSHDDGAFEAILRRHGPMVLGVCRRVLHNEADAEDAFQATFLVLVKKAASIRPRSMLGNWLYGVAHTTALKAKVMRTRRQANERKAAQCTSTQSGSDISKQLQELLDEELKGLPDKYRTAIVLCDLEGRTIKEAARQLGCPSGTICTRLARGRNLLSRRLARRALYLSGGMIATMITQKGTAASVPRLLMTSTMRAAAITAAGPTAASLVISAKVAALVDGVLKTMLFMRLKLISVLLVLAVLGVCAGRLLCQQASAEPALADSPGSHSSSASGSPSPVADARTPEADASGSPVMRIGTQSWRHSSDVNFVAFLPDGKSVVTADMQQAIRLWDRETGKEIRRFKRPDWKDADADADIDASHVFMMSGGFAQRNSSVALSPDGKTLAAVYGRTIQFWNVASGKPSGEIKGPARKLDRVPGNHWIGGVGAIAFSADGKTLVGRGCYDQTTYVWEVETAKEVAKVKINENKGRGLAGATGSGTVVMMSPDGKNLAWLEGDLVQGRQFEASLVIADRESAKEVRRFKLDGNGSSAMAYSPDGKLLAYVTANGIHLCEADSDKELHLLKGPEGTISSLIFSSDGKMLASRSAGDGKLVLWDAEKGQRIHEMEAAHPPAPVHGPALFGFGGMKVASHEVCFSPDGKTLAVGDGHVVRFFSTQTGKEESKQEGHSGPVTDIRVAADGKTIVSKSWDGAICRWDATPSPLGEGKGGVAKLLSSFQAPKGTRSIAIAPDGKTMALGNEDNAVHLHDSVTGKELHKFAAPSGDAAGVAFSRDGKTVAVRGNGKTSIGLFEVATGKEIKTIGEIEPAPRFVTLFILVSGGIHTTAGPALVFSPDGSTLATFLPGGPAIQSNDPVAASLAALELFHIKSGKSRRLELPNEHIPLNITYAPDGRTVAVEHADGTVALIEIASGQERRIGKEENLIMHSMQISRMPNKAVVNSLRLFAEGGPAAAAKIAFSPNSRSIAIVREDTIEIWDVASNKPIKNFKAPEGVITALAFAPDGETLVTGGSDTTLQIWDTSDLRSDKPAPEKLTDKQLEEAWANLKESNAGTANNSILELVKAPEQATQWLKKNLAPAAAADSSQVEKLIANLDAEDFDMRKNAIQELEKLGELAVPALEKTLESGPALEVKKRLEDLIDKAVGAFQTGDRLRIVRAVEVLEKIGTPDAREVLQTLAKGAAGALTTREAEAALLRMGK